MPRMRQVSGTVVLASSWASITCRIRLGVSFGGLPNRTFRCRAIFIPAAHRSISKLRSNSARTARTPTTIFPVAVPVSMLSITDTSFAPLPDPPPLKWLSRSLRGSCRKENALAEQVEAGATVHLPLDQLEPSDLPLRLAAAPRRRERRPDRSSVLLQPRRKRLESADPRPPGVGQPGVQRHTCCFRVDLWIDPTPAHGGHQPASQPSHVCSRRVLLDPRHEGCIRLRQRRRGLDEQPSKLRGGRQRGCAVMRSRHWRMGGRLGSPPVRGARGRGCPVLGHPALHLFCCPRKAGGVQLTPESQRIFAALRQPTL